MKVTLKHRILEQFSAPIKFFSHHHVYDLVPIIMPSTSRRTLALAKLRKEIREFEEEQSFKLLFDEDPLDVVDLLLDDGLQQKYERLSSQRFHYRTQQYRNSDSWRIFKEDLMDSSSPDCWLNDSEFRTKYGMCRESFWKLHDLIKDHKLFSNEGKKRKQIPSEYQLMVLLAFLRIEGDGMSDKKARSMFRLSCGAAKLYKDRVSTVIVETLFKKTVFWPDETER